MLRAKPRNYTTHVNSSTMTEPDYEPDMTPGDYYEDCAHAAACRMQWEREHDKFNDDMFGATDELARLLGCGEECRCFDDA